MNIEAIKLQVESVCREMGLDSAVAGRITARIAELPQAGVQGNAESSSEQEKMVRTQNEVMKLLGTKSPDKIIHDLRNVLNELGLLRALAGDDK